MKHENPRRLYCEERLQVRRRGGRKRSLGSRAPIGLPQGPKQGWRPDFLFDVFADGRRFRILAIVGDLTRMPGAGAQYLVAQAAGRAGT